MGLSVGRFHGIVLQMVEKFLPICRIGKRILPLAGMLLAGQVPLLAVVTHFDTVPWDKAPEPATFALIGGALCLIGLRLRRRG
jgi:hypothetical protein